MPEKSEKEHWIEAKEQRSFRAEAGPDTYRHFRTFSVAEIEEIAVRIKQIVRQGKVVHLLPATGYLCVRALERFAANPTRPEIVIAICGHKNCSRGPNCFSCIEKANAVISLYDNSSDDKELHALLRGK